MIATESVVRVDLKLRAPLNTNSENNIENKGKPSSKKRVVGKVGNLYLQKKKRRRNMNKLLKTFFVSVFC